jgi:hypothetical protein
MSLQLGSAAGTPRGLAKIQTETLPIFVAIVSRVHHGVWSDLISIHSTRYMSKVRDPVEKKRLAYERIITTVAAKATKAGERKSR